MREYFVVLKMKEINIGYIEEGRTHYISLPIRVPLPYERFKEVLKKVKEMGFKVKNYTKKLEDTGLVKAYKIYTHLETPEGRYRLKSIRVVNGEDRVYVQGEVAEIKKT